MKTTASQNYDRLAVLGQRLAAETGERARLDSLPEFYRVILQQRAAYDYEWSRRVYDRSLWKASR